MSRQGDPPASDPISLVPTRDASGDYRRLLATLASRARRLRSRDPEGAAQECLKRSLASPRSQGAVEYYFSDDLPSGLKPPEWPLDQLFAWLYGVLQWVVREEHHLAGKRREVQIGGIGRERSGEYLRVDPVDRAPSPLDGLLQKESQELLMHCLPLLTREYRAVLRMRANGLKYGEIADRLGVNENTVATWISRATRDLAQCVRRRSERLISLPRGGER